VRRHRDRRRLPDAGPCWRGNPSADSLLLGVGGEQPPSARSCRPNVYNTVDQPIFPTSGKRFTTSIDLAGLGGNTNSTKPMVEGVLVHQQASRLTPACASRRIHSTPSPARRICRSPEVVLGGEFSMPRLRHPHGRSAGSVTGLVLGGNKSLLFNVEEQITIAGPVRVILFSTRRGRRPPDAAGTGRLRTASALAAAEEVRGLERQLAEEPFELRDAGAEVSWLRFCSSSFSLTSTLLVSPGVFWTSTSLRLRAP